jgi:drug/metabolite transporter (DMT)-like permease
MTRFSQIPAQTRGILLMIVAIFAFTVLDLTAKALTMRVGVMQTLWARYAGQTLVVFIIILPNLKSRLRTKYPKLQLLRAVFMLGATTFFFIGLSHLGLAEITAIMDISPVLITLGAALFLGERFGPRRAFGVIAALIGAMIIIRPGSGVLSLYALLPVGAAVCYSGLALATRFVGQTESVWTSLFYGAVLGGFIFTAIIPFYWQTPDTIAILLMVTIGLISVLPQFFLIHSLTLAEASVVAPFGYVGLLFATVWGMIFFGDYPDAYTYLGAFIIVAAGVYVWHRENRGKEI